MQAGLGNLAVYLAAHALLCLVPAFYVAGGMTVLIPKEAVTRFLGRNTPRFISYPTAALAVCSCTIVPVFAGIHKRGAGLGPAITFLFFAPAGNILALAYTGVAIGPDLALARRLLLLALASPSADHGPEFSAVRMPPRTSCADLTARSRIAPSGYR